MALCRRWPSEALRTRSRIPQSPRLLGGLGRYGQCNLQIDSGVRRSVKKHNDSADYQEELVSARKQAYLRTPSCLRTGGANVLQGDASALSAGVKTEPTNCYQIGATNFKLMCLVYSTSKFVGAMVVQRPVAQSTQPPPLVRARSLRPKWCCTVL